MLDPRSKARLALIVSYLAAQLALIAYGLYTPDHVFGFQMFNESSRIAIHLHRQVLGVEQLVPVVDGAWQARDRTGQQRTFRWHDRVRSHGLARLDASVHASYGLAAQLYRLQAALDDVAAHIPDDTETLALVALVEASHNGHKQAPIRLIGARP